MTLPPPQQDPELFPEAQGKKHIDENGLKQLGGTCRTANTSLLLVCICALSVVEGIDQVLLPSVALALQQDLQLSLTHFAQVSLAQSLCMWAFAPMWGILADRNIFTRKSILICGAGAQGIITMILAGVDSFVPMIALRAANGAMLASLLPTVNGIIADIAAEHELGKLFGWSQLSCIMGSCVGALSATPLSRCVVAGVQGWRFVFLVFGLFSIAVATVAAVLMTEPVSKRSPSKADKAGSKETWCMEARRIWNYFKLPTFAVLVVQGCIGGIGWVALNYQTLFFQVQGLGDIAAAILQAFGYIAFALGNLLGGMIGDHASKKSPHHGRIFIAQISVVSGIPSAFMIFLAPPPQQFHILWYLTWVILLRMTASWACPGAIWPILSHLADPNARSSIMAWETALERSVNTMLGNMAVACMAQDIFGFRLNSANLHGDVDRLALGRTLALCVALPWLVCALLYSFLHWTLPRDSHSLSARRGAVSAQQGELHLSDVVQI